MIENLKGELWKQYRDTEYYFSSYGRVKRIYRHKERLLKPYRVSHRKGSELWVVKVYGKETSISRTVYELFIGTVPDGYNIIHRNKVQSDNAAVNLKAVSKRELGTLYGGRTRMQRLIYDMENKCFYKGTREAGKALHISRQTVSDYCNGKVKKPMFRLRWARDGE